MSERRVLAFVGQVGPVSIAEVARILRLPRREVEAAIEELRRTGHPIAADGRGVWLETDPERYAENVASRRRRAVRQLVNVRRERMTVRQMRMQRSRFSQEALPWSP